MKCCGHGDTCLRVCLCMCLNEWGACLRDTLDVITVICVHGLMSCFTTGHNSLPYWQCLVSIASCLRFRDVAWL